ncbi:MAG: SOS response-associated peptidase [Acidimicrobiales bacterium]
MCGRFALYSEPDRLVAWLDAELAPDLTDRFHPSWNVAPLSQVLGAREHDEQRQLELFSWGLVPGWAKDAAAAGRTFNARAETVATKPTFRAAFRRRRLLVPADGFYEWTAKGGPRQKVPHYFSRADGEPLALAGLWEYWRPAEGTGRLSATIITTAAGPDMDGVHDRQPVVLEPDTWERWLSPDLQDRDELEGLLHAGPAGQLRHWPVRREVGNVRNDGPDLVEPAD